RAGLHRQAAGRRRADRPHQRVARRLTMSRRRQHERKPSAASADAGRKSDAGKSGVGKTDIAKPEVGPLDPFAILVEYERKSLAHVTGLPEQLDAPGLWRGVGYRIGQ